MHHHDAMASIASTVWPLPSSSVSRTPDAPRTSRTGAGALSDEYGCQRSPASCFCQRSTCPTLTPDRPVDRAAGAPAHRVHLYDHPPPALGAVPRRLHHQRPAAVLMTAVGLRASTVAAEPHSVFCSSLTGILSSASRSRSAVAGRPRVVR